MTEWDKEYLKLCQKILKDGVEVHNRTGVNTIKIPAYNLHFDLKKEFPILQTKQLFSRQAIIEMLWIWQMGSNDVRELQERNVHIWDEWEVDDDGIYRIYEPYGEYDPDKEVDVLDPLSVPVDDPFGMRHEFQVKKDENGNIMKAKSRIEGKTIKMAKYYGPEYAGTIGSAYGFIVNRYNHTRNLIDTLKNNPEDRRMVKSLWQDEFLRTAVLPSCVWSTEWGVTNGELNLMVHQRSCDVPLGLPFNVTQYATLLKMIAQVTNLRPGTIDYSIKDAHIYVNQISMIKEQIRRGKRFKQLSKLSKKEVEKLLEIAKEKKSKIEDIKSEKYLELDTEERICDLVLNPTKPELELDPSITDFFEFDNSKDIKHCQVTNYKHMGKISIPVSQ